MNLQAFLIVARDVFSPVFSWYFRSSILRGSTAAQSEPGHCSFGSRQFGKFSMRNIVGDRDVQPVAPVLDQCCGAGKTSLVWKFRTLASTTCSKRYGFPKLLDATYLNVRFQADAFSPLVSETDEQFRTSAEKMICGTIAILHCPNRPNRRFLLHPIFTTYADHLLVEPGTSILYFTLMRSDALRASSVQPEDARFFTLSGMLRSPSVQTDISLFSVVTLATFIRSEGKI